MTNTPELVVRMLTYNQENYISQSIDSVLMQKTSFPFFIIIGEDCSTDSTREICIDYRNKYPKKIKLLLNKVNDIKSNSMNNFNACYRSNAKYIALLEGDDYWTDPNKLQKQYNFLEENKDCVTCHHRYSIYYENTGKFDTSHKIKPPDKASIFDLAKGNFIGTLTVMYRNANSLPNWFYDLGFGDYPVHLLNAQFGKIGFIDENMATYRVHKNGLSLEGDDYFRAQRFHDTFELFFANTNFDNRIVSLLNIQTIKILIGTIHFCYEGKDDKKMIDNFNKLKDLYIKTIDIPHETFEDIFKVAVIIAYFYIKKNDLIKAKDSIYFLEHKIPKIALTEILNSKIQTFQYSSSRSYKLGKFISSFHKKIIGK